MCSPSFKPPTLPSPVRTLSRAALWLALAAACVLVQSACPSDEDTDVDKDTSEDTGVSDDTSDGMDGSDVEPDPDTAPDTSIVGTLDDILRLNHLQLMGTHNSYHQRGEVVIHPTHDYSHLSLSAQLDLGVRAFEIDIHNPESLVEADDYAVYHITVLDPGSSCLSLKACLGAVVAWSDANPFHVPIAIWIEPKGDAGGFAIEDLPRLDTVIAGVVPEGKRITPASVQGARASLREALTLDGWPTLADSRGKIIFALLDTEAPRDVYTESLTKVMERLVFVGAKASEFNEDWAGVAKINNPGDAAIADAHAANILVASNICTAGEEDDVPCREATAAAEANGSQWLKTDYPEAEGNPYSFTLAPSCNPVTAPTECIDGAVE
ncbi:MAG: hypothetical protein ACI9MR_000276 [Myxococcota bacterium]|jgi:hypothetical protein